MNDDTESTSSQPSSSPSLPTAQPLRQVQLSLVVEDELDSLPPFDNLALESAEEGEAVHSHPHIVFETVDLTPALQQQEEVEQQGNQVELEVEAIKVKF